MSETDAARELIDRDLDLEASLAFLLRYPSDIDVALPVVTCLDELISCLQHARSATWRREQRLSLLKDIEAAVERLGPEAHAVIKGPLAEMRRYAKNVLVVRKKFQEHKNFEALVYAVETLQHCLRDSSVRSASWRDIVDGLRNDLARHIVEDRVRLLYALLEAAGREVEDDRRELRFIITHGNVALLNTNDLDVDMSTAERLAKCEALVAEPTQTGHCIAWVALAGTWLPRWVVEAGPVTLFMAQWAVPNAQNDTDHAFLYRDELREIATHPGFSVPQEQNDVLARVDLGERSVAGALEEGWRWALFLAGYATVSARTAPWAKRGWNVLQVGNVRHYGWFATDELDDRASSFQVHRVGRELERISATLTSKSEWLPGDLIEAVDSAVEARGTELRSRIILRFRVLEMIAACAGIAEVDDLLQLMQGQCAHDGLGSRIVRSVHWTLLGHAPSSELFEQGRRLSDLIVTYLPNGMSKIDLLAALENEEDLLTVARTPLERQSLRRDLEALTDGQCCLHYLARLLDEEDLLLSRLRRVRNALTHGNPTSLDAISSIDPYLMYLTEFALQEAIANSSENSLVKIFQGYKDQRDEVCNRLQAKEAPLQVMRLLPE